MSSKGFAMRKILISLLMASAAVTPTLAHAQDSAAERRAARQQAREDRASAREDRSAAREERSVTSEQRSTVREERANVREQRVAPVAQQRSATIEERRAAVRDRAAQVRQAPSAAAPTAAVRDSRRQQLAAERTEQRQARQARYAAIREARRHSPPPPISRTPQPNTQPPPPTTSRPVATPQWSSAWRHNSRYDWYNYRRNHRWLFNLGFYYDPFGWGYSPFSIGWRMWPSYYGSSYWLNDPWQYRLPYAPPGTRWIRYYDDAILVDMWSGQVIDVIYDFFW